MRQWDTRAVRITLGAIGVAGLLAFGACQSANMGTARSSGAPGTPPPMREMSAAARPAPASTPTADQVPQIDLQGVLRDGSGGGQSPFPDALSDVDARLGAMKFDNARPGSTGGLTPVGTVQNSMGLTASLNDGEAPAPVAAAAPMDFTLAPNQELLIIERRPPQQLATTDDYPGSGCMMTRCIPQPGQPEQDMPVPLKHTAVQARIAGPIASTTVTQQFANPFSSKIEAVYVFPLPDDAAVNDFVMTIGGRSIRGVIREREQAEKIYYEARAQGHHASLMTQERSNIFTQRVANIEPGEQIDVTITYFGMLSFKEARYEYVFPMTIGPRYNPASSSGSGVGAVPTYAAGTSGQSTEVQYLRPSQRSGHDVSLTLDLNAGVRIESIESPSHSVNVTPTSGGYGASVQLASYDSIPNRDFILRYKVAGDQVRGGVLTHSTERGGYFSMLLVPPSDLSYCQRGPVELVFVVDCSGSMSGIPLTLAKRSVQRALGELRSSDTFQIIRFSDKAEFLSSRPLAASPENIAGAERQVESLETGGGTQMLKGLEPALEARTDRSRTRFVCLISDGFLGNEAEVLGYVKRKLGDSRVFSVGIGSSPNRTLMNGMARLGRGCAAYVTNDQDVDETMRLFASRVSSAAMADISLDFGSSDISDVYPKRIPDLFVGRPIVITGRYSGTVFPGSNVRVSGRVGGQKQTFDLPVLATDAMQTQALPLVWARTKITDLDEDASWSKRVGAGGADGPNKREIRDLALHHNLMSAYTSFVAVDAASRTRWHGGTTVAVPVHVPQGTRYDTTVGE